MDIVVNALTRSGVCLQFLHADNITSFCNWCNNTDTVLRSQFHHFSCFLKSSWLKIVDSFTSFSHVFRMVAFWKGLKLFLLVSSSSAGCWVTFNAGAPLQHPCSCQTCPPSRVVYQLEAYESCFIVRSRYSPFADTTSTPLLLIVVFDFHAHDSQ